ncbi:Uncharacterized protein OS=Zunongwangia profunda (strain DSM 18752 / CCTCC AB 206139 / SM-A87) GN=ZPR_1391 PE=4 SV=1 [Gemmata massiliana]|uniref:TM2 domain-containing protein n=1 Tax=Gemmata massiliana TaxID=1210884 RepID=A0A6P2DL24_9BACT|nr:hypothetical protein [Gemmata massiliana]VTS01251.1 Uncharacterized protein OS=Zunongwangia profunda (strain DSM 18752 / CCTCC AB 206139 / SM-A87) GN=ZPR_1391 PE=4 SV=1 [Gemmata massiliana]
MPIELQRIRQSLRRRTRLLRSVEIRRAARRGFDLVHFGSGPVERLCAALILAALFVFVTLAASLIAKLGPTYGLALAGVAFLSALGASAVLVLWPRSDRALEAERRQLRDDVIALRAREADLLDAMEEELARREGARHRGIDRDARPQTRPCPYCWEVISARALKCRFCGEFVDEELARERQRAWNPGIAAILSFIIPGLGQVYKSQVLGGLVWFFVIDCVYAGSFVGMYVCCMGLLTLPVAVILHVVCIFDAAASGTA